MGFLGSSGSIGKITESDLPATVKEKLVKVNEIGDLSDLQTKNKSSLTAATNEVTTKLVDTEKKTTFKTKNLMDYSNDLLTAFNSAMSDSNHDVFHLDKGTFVTSDSLVFTRGKKLIFNYGAIVRTNNSKKPVFVMNRESELINPTIDVRGMEYNSSAILFDGDNYDCENSIVENPKIYGSYGVGSKGIEFKSTKDSAHYAMYNRVTNMYITHFHYGIYSEASNGGFSTGNVVDGRIFGCSHLLYLKGDTSGNRFDLMLQSGVKVGNEVDFYGVYCEGSFNEINGFVWDIDPNLTNNYCYFTKKSTGNILSLRPYNEDGAFTQSSIIDEGDRNTIGNLFPYQNVFLPPINAPTNGGGAIAMLGQQDNILAFLDKNPNFSIKKELVGVTEVWNDSYTPHSMFEPNSNVTMLFFDDFENSYARYTITGNLNKLMSIGAGFDGDSTCNMSIQLYENDSLVLEKTLTPNENIVYNSVENWNITMEYDGDHDNQLRNVNKIIVTFSKPNYHLFIRSLFASSTDGGNTYLTRSGGDIYDDLYFPSDKGVILRTPDLSKSYRLSIDNEGNLKTTLLP